MSKGIGKRGVEVIAVEMHVRSRGLTFWSSFVNYSGLIGNIYMYCMPKVIGFWIPFYNDEQNSERNDGVSPLSTVICAQVPVREFRKRLPEGCLSLI